MYYIFYLMAMEMFPYTWQASCVFYL